MEWGITTTRTSTITLPLAYTNFYIVVTGAHYNEPGGRAVHAVNRNLNSWTCKLGAGSDYTYNYWDNDTHWLTVGS